MTVEILGPLSYQFQNPCLFAGKNGWGSFGISPSSTACNSCIGGRSGSTRIAHRCRCHYTGNIGPPAWCGVQRPRQNRTIREESKERKYLKPYFKPTLKNSNHFTTARSVYRRLRTPTSALSSFANPHPHWQVIALGTCALCRYALCISAQ